MSRRSGHRFADKDMRPRMTRMSRRSGHRFADKDMRQRMTSRRGPIPQERDVL